MPTLETKKPVPAELRLFAKNLRAARLAKGLTQHQLNDIVHVGQGYISALERGVANIGIDTMSVLAHALQVPLFHLLKPDFERHYDFSDPSIWADYSNAIDSNLAMPYERKIFIDNIIKARLASGLKKKELSALADISQDFLLDLENGKVGIGLNKAVQLAHIYAQPLYSLLQP